jgi:hypothetical protein
MKKLVVLLVVASVLIFGCTTFKASGLAMISSGQKYEVLGDFHKEVWVNGFLGSPGGAKLFNISADASEGPVKDAIAAAIQEKGGTAAINITIENQGSFVDYLLCYITGDIYAPSLVIISGTVVK